MPKILMLTSLILILLTVGKWVYDSSRYGAVVYYTKQSRIVTVKEQDPMFGTTIEKSVTENGPWFGLLDVAFPFGAVPMCGVWLCMGVTGFVLQRRKRRATATV